jgi:mRNA-degrading endonuclease RelE of RelBE toxin-antitoxin system
VSSYAIITTKRFLRRLRKLDHSIRERILDAVHEISENPHTGSTLSTTSGS